MFATLNSWAKEFHVSAKFYYEDLPSINCFDSDLWLAHWLDLRATTDLPNSVTETLKMIDSELIRIYQFL